LPSPFLAEHRRFRIRIVAIAERVARIEDAVFGEDFGKTAPILGIEATEIARLQPVSPGLLSMTDKA
jgi:hypothetical protein